MDKNTKNETLLKSDNCDRNPNADGLTYYKLISPYAGDYTKNCGLVGSDLDENFFFLRGYDISSVTSENGILKIDRVNGETIEIPIECALTIKPEFSYNENTGKITITYPDGETAEVDGFLFTNEIDLSTDGTIKGNGSVTSPLRLSNAEKTGTYSPADEYFDIVGGGMMPEGKWNGYRVVTKEDVNYFGRLYPSGAIELIQDKLDELGSEWRIPSKDDWDELLNAMECEEDRNHGLTYTDNRGNLGRVAGQCLKSAGTYENEVGDGDGLWKRYDTPPTQDSVNGMDIAGMSILPVGRVPESATFVDANDINGEFGLVASFWTSTKWSVNESEKLYTKTFAYNSAQVMQDAFHDAKLSIRFVKDYDGSNYNEIETILGLNYPTTLVRGIHDDFKYSKIWTCINFYDDSAALSGITSSEWDAVPDEYKNTTTIFYINEWNGTEWEKKPMREGDSVVILDKEGVEYREWRVVHGELVDTYSIVKEEFENEFGDIEEQLIVMSAITSDLSGLTFVNGTQRIDNEVSIKINDNDEGYLVVNEGGLMTSGLSEAIHSIISGSSVNANVKSSDIKVEQTVSATVLSLKFDDTLSKYPDITDGVNVLGTNLRIKDATTASTESSIKKVYELVDGNGNAVGDRIEIDRNGLIKSARVGRIDDVIDSYDGTLVNGVSEVKTIQVIYYSDGEYKNVNIPVKDILNLGNGLQFSDLADGYKLSVKKSPASEPYLNIDENGLSISGITDAIAQYVSMYMENFIATQLPEIIKNEVANYIEGVSYETKVFEENGKLKVGFADDAIFGENPSEWPI